MPLRKIYQSEHSPIRTQLFWIEMINIPTFVSVHLVRHKIGVEHFVMSNRDDLGGKNNVESRLTPVNHAILINAQALIFIGRRRLCYKSHRMTVAVMRKIVKAVREVDPDLADYIVPECVYRNGYCPELSECRPGLTNIVNAYQKNR